MRETPQNRKEVNQLRNDRRIKIAKGMIRNEKKYCFSKAVEKY